MAHRQPVQIGMVQRHQNPLVDRSGDVASAGGFRQTDRRASVALDSGA